VVNMINDDPFPSDFEWLAERIYSKTFPEHRKETDLLCACECQGQCLSGKKGKISVSGVCFLKC
jgi:hypothetical protein